MVGELLGPTLEDLFEICDRQFSLQTTLMLWNEVLTILESVHERGFLHRDIKPDNLLLGYGSKSSDLYAVDFGLAKRYRQPNGQHIPFSTKQCLTGTARFCSLNAHKGYDLSRRDDLEASIIMMLYLLKGHLPWLDEEQSGNEVPSLFTKIGEMKSIESLAQFCSDVPPQFLKAILYCRQLQFWEQPDYALLRNLIFECASQNGCCLTEKVYDWAINLNCKDKHALEKRCLGDLIVKYCLTSEQTQQARTFQFKDFKHLHDIMFTTILGKQNPGMEASEDPAAVDSNAVLNFK